MKPEKNGAGVIIFDGNKVLLVKHGPKASHLNGTYIFPCGTIESGETPKIAAVRELREESGIDASELNLIEFPNNYFESELTYKGDRKVQASMIIFICKKYSGQLKGSDEANPEWHNFEEIKNLNLLPNVATAINNAKAYLNT